MNLTLKSSEPLFAATWRLAGQDRSTDRDERDPLLSIVGKNKHGLGIQDRIAVHQKLVVVMAVWQ
jgi:hypothetical protein